MRLPLLMNDNNLIPWAQEMVRALEYYIKQHEQSAQNRGEPFVLGVYTVATLPDPTLSGQLIYVSNESGGATLAFSDGSNWRRVQDRAVCS